MRAAAWRVLDIAAGRGAITEPATDAVGTRGEVIAIDNAPKMLAALRPDHPGRPQLGCRVMDTHQLDLPDNYVDVVTCGFTLHFLDDPATAISEAPSGAAPRWPVRLLRPADQ
ncbi:class I SAM-dependent methyltransferase [Streptomyces sp. RK75]|nr:class I SAM-dependent methyltransferase [Streptomyces sp. RK75]